jgi:hypothetical protein
MEKKQEKKPKKESPKKTQETHGKRKKDSVEYAVNDSLSKTTTDVKMRNRILDILMNKK